MRALAQLLTPLLGGLLVIAVGGCSDGRGGSIPYDATLPQPDNQNPVPYEDSGVIRRSDELAVKVFQVPELSGTYKVDLTGDIDMPLIGTIKAAGRTSTQLKTELERLYGSQYLQDPDITVMVAESNPRTLTVEGSVKDPGIFPIDRRTTLLQAIALANGPTDLANERRVVIFRTIDGVRQAAAFDLRSIRAGEMDDPVVYGNDLIVIDGSDRKAAFRTLVQAIPLLTFTRVF